WRGRAVGLIIRQIFRPRVRKIYLRCARKTVLPGKLQTVVIRTKSRLDHRDRAIASKGTKLIENGFRRRGEKRGSGNLTRNGRSRRSAGGAACRAAADRISRRQK